MQAGVGDPAWAADRRDDWCSASRWRGAAGIAGIERMVGLFINTLPLRVRLPASKR